MVVKRDALILSIHYCSLRHKIICDKDHLFQGQECISTLEDENFLIQYYLYKIDYLKLYITVSGIFASYT